MARIELPFWRRLETQTYEGASAIFSRSHYVARSLRDDYGISPEKIHVVGAGVNIPLPDPATLPTRDQPRALFIGSDFRRKGGDVLLAAWPEVLRRVPDAVLTIIGPANGPLPRNVESNGGTWEPATILQELQRSSVFVMPSRCETWGDVFLEAMAYALPCIGSSNDAMPEIIDDGQTGYIVPLDDPVALADRLSCLLGEPGTRQQVWTCGASEGREPVSLVRCSGQDAARTVHCVTSDVLRLGACDDFAVHDSEIPSNTAEVIAGTNEFA